MNCPICGGKNPNRAKSCKICGTGFDRGQEPAPVAPAANDSSLWRDLKAFGAALGGWFAALGKSAASRKALIVILALVLAGAGFLAERFLFRRDLLILVKGERAYGQYMFKETFMKHSAALVDLCGVYAGADSGSGSVLVSARGSAENREAAARMAEALGLSGPAANLLETLAVSSLDFGFGHDRESSAGWAKSSWASGGAALLELDEVIKGGSLYMRAPGAPEKYWRANVAGFVRPESAWLDGMAAALWEPGHITLNYSRLAGSARYLGENPGESRAAVKAALDACFGSLGHMSVDRGAAVRIGDKNMRFDRVTVSMTQGELNRAAAAALGVLREDYLAYVHGLIMEANPLYPILDAELEDILGGSIEALNDGSDFFDDRPAFISLYVNAANAAQGFELKTGGGAGAGFVLVPGAGYRLWFNQGDKSAEIYGSFKGTGPIRGDAYLTVYDSLLGDYLINGHVMDFELDKGGVSARFAGGGLIGAYTGAGLESASPERREAREYLRGLEIEFSISLDAKKRAFAMDLSANHAEMSVSAKIDASWRPAGQSVAAPRTELVEYISEEEAEDGWYANKVSEIVGAAFERLRAKPE